MNKIRVVNFNDSLFTDAIKEKLNQKISGSNIISNKIGEEIINIDFYLKKEGGHEFNLSVVTNFNGKLIHINEKGEDTYVLIDEIISKLERSIRKCKEKK